MCEIHAFVLKNGRKEKIFESVNLVETEGDEVSLVNIFGEQKTFKGRFKNLDNNNRMILFEPIQENMR